MFGTVAILKPKSGKEADVVRHFDTWWQQRAGKVPGALGGEVRRNAANPAELIVTVSFDSEGAYRSNANDPQQDAWFQDLLAMLEGEPRWIDGEILSRRVG